MFKISDLYKIKFRLQEQRRYLDEVFVHADIYAPTIYNNLTIKLDELIASFNKVINQIENSEELMEKSGCSALNGKIQRL